MEAKASLQTQPSFLPLQPSSHHTKSLLEGYFVAILQLRNQRCKVLIQCVSFFTCAVTCCGEIYWEQSAVIFTRAQLAITPPLAQANVPAAVLH